jgi:hypothetical protein
LGQIREKCFVRGRFCMAVNTAIGRTKQTIAAAEFHLDSHKLWIFQFGSESRRNLDRALGQGSIFWARWAALSCTHVAHLSGNSTLRPASDSPLNSMGLFWIVGSLIVILFSCRNGSNGKFVFI